MSLEYLEVSVKLRTRYIFHFNTSLVPSIPPLNPSNITTPPSYSLNPTEMYTLPQLHMRHHPIPPSPQHLSNLLLLRMLAWEQYIARRTSVGWFASAARSVTKLN